MGVFGSFLSNVLITEKTRSAAIASITTTTSLTMPQAGRTLSILLRFLLPRTSPTFCTTASERVYITTSSGKDANGGSQGAVGDAESCHLRRERRRRWRPVSRAECGRIVLYTTRHFSITICASLKNPVQTFIRSFPLKLSQ